MTVRFKTTRSPIGETLAFVDDNGTEVRVRIRTGTGPGAIRCDTHGTSQQPACDHVLAVLDILHHLAPHVLTEKERP